MDQSWAGSYTPIRQCNLVLEKVKDIEMSDESRKKLKDRLISSVHLYTSI